MFKKNMIAVFFIFFYILNIFSLSNKIYVNDTLGIKFSYPEKLELFQHTGLEPQNKINHKFIVSMYIDNIDKLNADPYIDIDYYKEFRKLQKKKGFIDEGELKYEKMTYEYFSYKNKVLGQIYFSLSNSDINQIYAKGVQIKIKNYFLYITIDYFDFLYSIPDRYPEYFERIEREIRARTGKDKDGNYIMGNIKVKDNPNWKEPVEKNYVEFYNLIKNKSEKAPKELVALWEYFDIIINSLELFEPAKYVTPTVKKLSLRKGSSINDERIRMITQGEKLEVLNDIDPPELIDGDYGFWVKVKTIEGEIGWCFDAYLEEVE